jgi:SnoaL-like domain
MGSAEDVCTLWDIEQIKRLKARYFRAMDTKDWDGFAELFARDAVAGEGERAVQGRDAVAEFIKFHSDRARSVHHGHMPEIDVPGDGTATGIFAMFDYYEERSGEPPKGFVGYGHYYDTFVFEEGAWRIATMVLRRLRIDPLPGGLPDLFTRR